MYYRNPGLLMSKVSGGSFPFTDDFIAATGLSDATTISEMHTLESGLTLAGEIDHATPANNKWYALYLSVGTTGSMKKWNFLDPRDLDAAYRVTFNGGWTHGATGSTGNGTDTLADSHFNALTVWGTGFNASMFFVSRTAGTDKYDMSFGDGSNGLLISAYTNNNAYAGWTGASFTATVGSTDGSGFWGLNHNGSALTELIHNGSSVASATEIGGAGNFDICLGGAANNTLWTSREYNVWGIGKSHTNGEWAAFYTLINNFNTGLSR